MRGLESFCLWLSLTLILLGLLAFGLWQAGELVAGLGFDALGAGSGVDGR